MLVSLHWLMNSYPTQHIFTNGFLLAAAVFSIAATGVIASSAILGQQYSSLAFAQETATTAAANATDTSTTGGANKLAGIIASLQIAPDRLAPEWVAAGYWELESDMPLVGGTNETEPTVTDFNAIVEMTRLADGTFLHNHTFSDFRLTDILHTAENTTTINGTMTVVDEEGPTENVPVYITLQNNLISIAVDPVTTENHFGPTPINGIILTPEHLQEISNRLAPTAEEGAGTDTTTAGQQQ
jgi:hypothetical protein